MVSILALQSSRAGESKDQQLAASITPAAKPNIPSNINLFISFSKNTNDAPTAVTNQVKEVANNDCRIGLRSTNDRGITIKNRK